MRESSAVGKNSVPTLRMSMREPTNVAIQIMNVTVLYEIFGYDFAETDSVAHMLQDALRRIPGTADVMISRPDYQPEFQVDFDREKLALYGLNLSTAFRLCHVRGRRDRKVGCSCSRCAGRCR